MAVDTRHFKKVAAYLALDDAGSPSVGATTPLPIYGPSPLATYQTGTILDVTLTLDTLIYASGDVFSDTATLVNAVRINGGRATLKSVAIIDEDDVGGAVDLIFFSVTQNLGTKNTAPALSDVAARDCLGWISLVAADYIDMGGVKVATKQGLNLKLVAASASRDLFLATITRFAGTHTANGVRLRLGIDWD